MIALGIGLLIASLIVDNPGEEWRWKDLEGGKQSVETVCLDDIATLDKVIRAWGFNTPGKFITLGNFGGPLQAGLATLLYIHPKNGEMLIVTMVPASPDGGEQKFKACTTAALVPLGQSPVQELPEFKGEVERHNQQSP